MKTEPQYRESFGLVMSGRTIDVEYIGTDRGSIQFESQQGEIYEFDKWEFVEKFQNGEIKGWS